MTNSLKNVNYLGFYIFHLYLYLEIWTSIHSKQFCCCHNSDLDIGWWQQSYWQLICLLCVMWICSGVLTTQNWTKHCRNICQCVLSVRPSLECASQLTVALPDQDQAPLTVQVLNQDMKPVKFPVKFLSRQKEVFWAENTRIFCGKYSPRHQSGQALKITVL